ncbi:MAG: indolepyruvate oxidoreductase subunit beta [Acidobacteria bacterium]|nr:indolepyruvate oxidoreductase subunit beta [Acidobacteriota bacterium]
MKIINIMLSGVGGQGILTSGRILALAALDKGLDVKMSEVHGMSQRGGNVDSHIRIGENVPSSLIPKGGADYLLSFEMMEGLRYLDYLKPEGKAIISKLKITPLSSNLKKGASYPENIEETIIKKAPNVKFLEAEKIAKELGDIRMVNVILLGAMSKDFTLLDKSNFENAIKERFSPKVAPLCLKAFERGIENG